MNGTTAYQLDSATEYIAAYDRSEPNHNNKRFLLRVRNDIVGLAEREIRAHKTTTDNWMLCMWLCHEIDQRIGPDFTGA